MPQPNPELDILVNEIAELRPLPVVALRVLALAGGIASRRTNWRRPSPRIRR